MAQSLANAFYAASQYALVAVALSLAYSVARFLNFALGAIYTVAAYSTFIFIKCGFPVAGAACVGILVAALFGAALELLVFGKLRQRSGTPLVALLAALGLLVVIQGVVSIFFGESVKIIRTANVTPGLDCLGARLTHIQIIGIAAGLFGCGATWAGIRFSAFGRQFRAVASDPALAEAVGVSSTQVYFQVAVISAFLAGLAGVVGAYDIDLRPTMGFPPLLMGVVAMLVGGAGKPIGACLAAFAIGGLQEFAVRILPTQWQQTVVFAALVVILSLRTKGHSAERQLVKWRPTPSP